MLGKVWNYFAPDDNNTQNDSPSLQGTLYIKDLGKPIQKLAEECTISLSIKDEKSYNYVIDITNEDDTNWKTMTFALNVDSNFCKYVNASGSQCIMWLKGETFYILELFCDEEIFKNEPIFIKVLSTLITSNDFRIPIEEAKTEKTREQYVPDFNQIDDLDKFLEQNFKELKVKKMEKKLIDEMNDLSIQKLNKKDFQSKYSKYKEICEYKGISLKYKPESESFIKLSENDSFMKIVDIGDFSYLLVLEDKECILVYTQVDSHSSILVDENLYSVSFLTHVGKTYTAYTFSLIEKDKINKIKNLISKCLYETTTKSEYNKLSKQAQEFIDYEGVYEEDFTDDEDSQIKKQTFNFDKFDEMNTSKKEEKIKNKYMTQAYKFDRTLVIKDNNAIDVLNTDSDGNKLIKNQSFNPFDKKENIQITGAKMFSGDNQILFKDGTNKDSLWQYDLNKESVIEEWKCGENGAELLDFTHATKFGQLDPQCDILGINKNKIFAMDGRVNRKNKIVEDKIYGSGSSKNFTCISTPGFNAVATGSEDGNIRLYNDITRNAKTLIPCFGDPIRSLDITKSGDYILATCDKYILLINTRGDNNENAFTYCLKRARRKPKTLKLSPVDIVKYGLQDDCYTPAKFNVSKLNNETRITSSLGQYIIVWNFDDIKKGIVDAYKIRNVNEFVLGNTTKFDKNQLIVTMPNKIRLQNEKIIDI